MHWCMDETLLLMAMIPVIGIFFRKLHMKWHKNHHHKCHEQTCNEEHVEHTSVTWTPLTQETVEAKFGKELVQDLYDSLAYNGMFAIQPGEVLWLYDGDQELQAEVRFRTFVHGYNQCEHGWDEVK